MTNNFRLQKTRHLSQWGADELFTLLGRSEETRQFICVAIDAIESYHRSFKLNQDVLTDGALANLKDGAYTKISKTTARLQKAISDLPEKHWKVIETNWTLDQDSNKAPSMDDILLILQALENAANAAINNCRPFIKTGNKFKPENRVLIDTLAREFARLFPQHALNVSKGGVFHNTVRVFCREGSIPVADPLDMICDYAASSPWYRNREKTNSEKAPD